MYTCPVCDYDELKAPPRNHLVCPRCSTHFDYDDAYFDYDELRARWDALGQPWFSSATPEPEDYEPVDREIRTLGYGILWMTCCFVAFVPALGALIGIVITATVGVLTLLIATFQAWRDLYIIRSMPYL